MKAPIPIFPLARAATDFLPSLLKEQESTDNIFLITATWLRMWTLEANFPTQILTLTLAAWL